VGILWHNWADMKAHKTGKDDVPEILSVQPSRDNQTKPYQLQQFLKMIEEYDLKLDNDEDAESKKETGR